MKCQALMQSRAEPQLRLRCDAEAVASVKSLGFCRDHAEAFQAVALALWAELRRPIDVSPAGIKISELPSLEGEQVMLTRIEQMELAARQMREDLQLYLARRFNQELLEDGTGG